MQIVLNEKQTSQLSEFLSNMAVALIIGALLSPSKSWLMYAYIGYGTISLYLSIRLLRTK